MRRFYIASHGDFSKGIKHSLEMIAGHSAAAVPRKCRLSPSPC